MTLKTGKGFWSKALTTSGSTQGPLRSDHLENSATGNRTANSKTSPTVGAAFKPADWLKLRANFAKGFRAPTPMELTLDYDTGYGIWKGNLNLTPETNSSYEVGFDVETTYWHLDVDYFHSVYKNKIESDYVNNTFFNADRAVTSAGFEFGTSFSLGSYLGWDFDVDPYLKGTYF
ncbi:MAG: TonB-dependent receptor, partial [Candidatus Adiutrix sp.]|nr:TonB-dependent receptor [Candidatus Adiutrix sp.]